ncbi:cell division protein FtsA [Croceicoccus estronivorus]|uniref:cell division protein FtsA n=1 Tax=Croceicoccus estronivorus TaxID=1172626 RepID=UPI00083089DB|nr:cell division protein FtsA [Croceicoccus estronivorus]OCC25195.1 cell division protein FtsA [Croceicoccus estronivorus]
MAATPRITRVFGAVNIGSFRISAMIAGLSETGEMIVLGSGHRAAQGIKRGYVTDMAAATYAVRDAIERAERIANTSVQSVWIGCSGAGLASRIAEVEIEIGGRRIEEEDIERLLAAGRDSIQPDGRMVLHAQPAHYTLDGAHGVSNPKGLHAERLGVDIHVMMADGAPIRNITEAVQNAHLDVEGVVGSPVSAGYACLSPEERELGVALVEFGGEVTNVSVHAGGMLLGLTAIPIGSADITDAIASAFGIRRFQAERLKCVAGSAIASPADHREMIPINGPGEEQVAPVARHADDRNRIPRAELISVITGQLDILVKEIAQALKEMGFAGPRGHQVVLTGGGAELAGIADYTQGALGKPVRIGRPPALRGLPEAHSVPGFATLAGLVLYAAADPVDIRSLGPRHQSATRYSGLGLVDRVFGALKEYF